MNGENLVPPRMLFEFAVPCYWHRNPWPARQLAGKEKYKLLPLIEVDGRSPWADVCAAWNESGLAFWIEVRGKRRALWCPANHPEECDGLHLWIDTRNVRSVHRATKFCHRFLFAPTGGGEGGNDPLATWIPIRRAKAHPRPIPDGALLVRSKVGPDGYALECYVSAKALTGFDPEQQPQLGFNYAVIDREFGEQTLSAGQPMPYDSDPSFWVTLELVR